MSKYSTGGRGKYKVTPSGLYYTPSGFYKEIDFERDFYVTIDEVNIGINLDRDYRTFSTTLKLSYYHEFLLAKWSEEKII